MQVHEHVGGLEHLMTFFLFVLCPLIWSWLRARSSHRHYSVQDEIRVRDLKLYNSVKNSPVSALDVLPVLVLLYKIITKVISSFPFCNSDFR